ncbi:DUF1513 domain-containing protein [Maritalea mobilis]|uniref:DUF1513 domain-containing protein n=1 Tax=Maritalea mobilis TaxID=483324 RepID=UPI001C9537A1|nr:DUF1513 domain-containing protein [Maritalea mobilis]MBY6202810.1 DUF1513 domain-containing protein [Maritalea mobilis]
MTTRRGFLASLAAIAACPHPGWADAGSPDFLSAARAPDGSYRLCGLTGAGEVLFDLPMPDRGHAAAAHPERPEAVAFARRPGNFALVIDCREGQVIARLETPENRHFYGHGAFSMGGDLLFTPENDLDTLDGVIGVWDVAAGYRRVGEFPSGGVGPHDVMRLPGSERLVIANGGIATHPDTGRVQLNAPTMRANLAYADPESGPVEVVELDVALRQNSIRHLAMTPSGMVAAAMQWQGSEGEHPPLLFTHEQGQAPRLLSAPEDAHRQMRHYAGSVSVSGDGRELAITSPRGGLLQRFDRDSGAFLGAVALEDVCGVGPDPAGGFFASTGTGVLTRLSSDRPLAEAHTRWAWDNHLVAV